MSEELNPISKELNSFFKLFFGMAAIIALVWLAFWGTVVGVGVFLLFKYLI